MVHPADSGGQGQSGGASGSNNVTHRSKKYCTRTKFASTSGQGTLQIRDSIMTGLVNRYMAHIKENGGTCKRGFQKDQLAQVTHSTPTMNITADDIKNALKKRRREEEMMAQPEVATITTTTYISTAYPTNMHTGPPIEIDLAIWTEVNPTVGIPPPISDLTTTAPARSTRTISPDTTPLEVDPAVSIPATASIELTTNAPVPVPVTHTICLETNSTTLNTVAITPSDVNTTVTIPSVLHATTTDRTENNTTDTNATSLPSIFSDTSTTEQTKNKGGRPKGSTNESKRAYANALVSATNHVVAKYAELLSTAKSTDKRVERGTLSTLCEDTKRDFKLSGKFIVSKQLINHRFSTGRLRVQHRGVSSPLALPATVLKAIITSAAAVNHPLNVGTTLALMNNLVKDTKYEEHFTEFKVVRRMKASNPCKPLIGTPCSKALNNGRRKNMASNAARGNAMTSDDLRSTYRNVRRMTAGTVFGKGNGVLGPEVRDEVVCRVEARRV